MQTQAFEREGAQLYVPFAKKEDTNGKVWVKIIAHDALTAKTSYKVIVNEYGYVTAAMTTAAAFCYIGVPEHAIDSGAEDWIQIGGYVASMITPSLSVSVGHALCINNGVVADRGADYSGAGTEFAICTTASTTSTTQNVILMPYQIWDRFHSISSTLETDGSVWKAGAGDEFAPSANTIVNDTADAKFVSLWFDNGAATGTARGMYLKLYLTGGAGGEALRAYCVTTDDTPADTCNGAHISLGFGETTGNITGLGTAGRFTVMVPDRSLGGGVAALQAELWACGDSSACGGILAHIRFVIDGNATGITALTQSAGCVAFWFDAGCVDATDGVVDTNRTGTTCAGSIKIYISGVGMRWMKYYSD